MKIIKSNISLSRVWLSTIILCINYATWASLHHLPDFWKKFIPSALDYTTVLNISHVFLFLSIYAVIASAISVVMQKICARYQGNPVWKYLLSLIRALKIGAFFVTLNIASFALKVPASFKLMLYQANHIAMLSILGWCAFQMIQAGEVLVLQQLSSSTRDSRDVRRRYTHIVVIKRILVLLLGVMTGSAILMTFEKIRAAGAAILTSAGVFVTIVSLSARGLLESIFKGLQLAISQPVRLEDTVTIGGETGIVTSITLHHVVVTLNDHSQLIVPTGEFLDKTFRNWTHSSDDLIGTVSFSVSPSVPTEAIRNKFKEILKASECWDQNIGEVNVNDFKKNAIELRLTMSAKSGRQLAKLRNEVLEKLLEYMQTTHPDGLVN